MKKYLHTGPITQSVISTQLENISNTLHTGAQVSFLGRVRSDIINFKNVQGIIYSAYEEMVEKEFSSIELELMSKYPDLNTISIIHAIGEVKVGEVAMAVNICGGHRKEALEAISEIIDTIKHRVPIWKKEIFADGDYVWTENAKVE